MTGRFVLWAACVVAAVVVAIAQSNVNQAENPPVVDESRPTSVATPTSDAQMNAAGQPLAPRPTGPQLEPPPATMQPETQPDSEEAVAGNLALVPTEPSRKLWRFTPLFSSAVVYDDNIFLTNADRVADLIWTLSAGLAFQLGDFRSGTENFVTAYWLGIPVFYSDNPEQNAFNQSGALSGQYRWNKLVARIDSSFNITKGPNREVNTITTTKGFSNALRFQYDYSDKTSFTMGGSQVATVVESFENTNQYQGTVGMDYQLFPKTRVGLEGVVGVIDSASDPLQYYQRGLLLINYTATGKLVFKFSGGIEVMQFQGSDMMKINPVFSLGLNYQPFVNTNVSLVGYRNVVGSNAVAGQDFTATGFELTATQRFFQKYVAAISVGYENDVYFATGNAPPTDRVDNYVYARPRLSYSFVDWLSASVFYEFRKTASNQPTSSFYDNRFGMEVATKF